MAVPNQVAIAAALRQIAELEQRVAALERAAVLDNPRPTTDETNRAVNVQSVPSATATDWTRWYVPR